MAWAETISLSEQGGFEEAEWGAGRGLHPEQVHLDYPRRWLVLGGQILVSYFPLPVPPGFPVKCWHIEETH